MTFPVTTGVPLIVTLTVVEPLALARDTTAVYVVPLANVNAAGVGSAIAVPPTYFATRTSPAPKAKTTRIILYEVGSLFRRSCSWKSGLPETPRKTAVHV